LLTVTAAALANIERKIFEPGSFGIDQYYSACRPGFNFGRKLWGKRKISQKRYPVK
jgi:hypothetical protein